MATPRCKLVDPERTCGYHLVSRCVRRAWLCGRDRGTGRDFSHRRRWLVNRLRRLACCFAVDLDAYAVMSNHFHVVVRHDPKACESWSADEVARRWVEAFPPTEKGEVAEERKEEVRELLLGDPQRLERLRRTLGSLSSFMKHLKQPIARRANEEDGCQGHFFEQRFYSGALLSDEAVRAAMAYVDLNPVRAGLARRLDECREASIGERLSGLRENSAEALAEYLRPLASGLGDAGRSGRPGTTLAAYVALLATMVESEKAPPVPKPAEAGRATEPALGDVSRWLALVSALHKRQRAYGTEEALARWASARGLRLREPPLPV